MSMESNITPYQAEKIIAAKSVLVFAPHPDDESIGCGGLLAAFAWQGVPVDVLFASSGDFGEHGAVGADVRERESQAACKLLSVRNVMWWREPDRALKFNERTISNAMQAAQESGADLLLCPAISEIHPDHRNCAWIVIEAARRLNRQGQQVSVAMYEVGAPLHHSNCLIDISDQVDTKRAAIRCYESQLALSAYDELILGLNKFRSYTLGEQVQYAEAYRVLTPQQVMQPTLLAEPELQRQERLKLTDIESDCAKVSILIRSMGRDTLTRALDAVALQSWPNIEVLLLNAKGTGHPAVPLQAGSFPVRFIDSDEGYGRTEAANALLQAADGEFAMFLDDDDWITADHVSHLVAHLQAHAELPAAYSGVELGELTEQGWQVEHVFNDTFDRHRLLFENYLPIHSVMFRVGLVRDNMGCLFDTELRVFEDWDFWLQVSRATDLQSTGQVTACYHKSAGQGSEVFVDSDFNRSQRAYLNNKWLSELDGAGVAGLLEYARRCFVDAQQAQRQVLHEQARVDDLMVATDNLQLQKAELEKMVAGREQEIENFRLHVAGLEQMLRDKDTHITELTSALQTLQTLQANSRRRLWLLRQMLRTGS